MSNLGMNPNAPTQEPELIRITNRLDKALAEYDEFSVRITDKLNRILQPPPTPEPEVTGDKVSRNPESFIETVNMQILRFERLNQNFRTTLDHLNRVI